MMKMLCAFLLLGLLSTWGCEAEVPINGNSDLGIAFDLHYYASVNGLQHYLPPVFQNPNTNHHCSDGQTEWTASSDISCAFNGYGGASGSSVNTSTSIANGMSIGAGFSAGFGGFKTSINTQYDSSYFYTNNFASTEDSGLYHSYTLTMNWRSRGLTNAFISDAKGSASTCSLCSKYGYYFLVGGQYGGEYKYTQSQSFSYYNSSSSMTTDISSGFAGFSASSSFGQHSSGSSSSSYSQYFFTYQGCDYRCLQASQHCSWIDSCKKNPALYDFIGSNSFATIQDIFNYHGFSSRATQSATCIKNYLNTFTPAVFTSVLTTTPATIVGFGGVKYNLACERKTNNGFVTSITIGQDTHGYQSISCEYSYSKVDNPATQNYYFTESQQQRSGNYGSTFESVTIPHGYGIIGLQVLSFSCGKSRSSSHTNNNTRTVIFFGKEQEVPADHELLQDGAPEGSCTSFCGFRMYTAPLNFHNTKAPFIGAFNSNRYSNFYANGGCPWTHASNAKFGPSNSIMTSFTMGTSAGLTSFGARAGFSPLIRQ